MDAILTILLLFTASHSASALCSVNCDNSRPCSDVYSCLSGSCSTLTENDLPAKCKCYEKCREEFNNLRIRKDNCIFLRRLQTCFQAGGCNVSNVPELQKFEKECNNCEPKQCNNGSCIQKLECLTNSTRGGCSSAAAVQSVMNTTSETMHNAWFLPVECNCVSMCAFATLRYIPSCMGYETIKKCAFEHSCPLKQKLNLAPCSCEYACSSYIDRAMQATNASYKCTAKNFYVECAKKFGCNRMPIKLKNIICVTPPENRSSFFGSKIQLTIIIVFTILFAFITTNVIMA